LSWKLGAVIVLAAVAAVVVLTRPGNGKTAYVHRNEALLASLPAFPGAVKIRQASSSRASNCRPPGYGTIVDYQVPKGTRAMAVARFYAARLRRRGWHGSIQSEPILGAAPFRKLGKNRGVGFVGGSPLRKIGKTFGVAFVRGDASVNIGTDDMMILTDRPLREQHILWRYSIGIDYRGALVRCAED
jgi:hypothetical protein